jgi:DNA-binding transcriptional MocR family regulator
VRPLSFYYNLATVVVRYQIQGRGAAEICASIEAGVLEGALAPGASLPPVRQLAQDLGVAANTVAAAYRDLRQRGVIETAGRNGTRIRPRPPVAARLSLRVPPPPGVVDLSTGEPDLSLLPALAPALRQLVASANEPVSYAGGGPWPELVELARARFAADGLPMVHSGLTVTSGTLHAFELLLSSRLRPGDRVGVEDPGWANLIDLVAALGLDPVPMAIDDEGPTVDGLRRALNAGVGAIVVTSRAHNPTGASISANRAAQLRKLLADAEEVLVIEDDHAAELAEQSLHPLATQERAWAVTRSVSKPYGPDLRLAVVAGDSATIAHVEGRMRLSSGWVSTVIQRLVVELWRDERVAATVERASQAYGQRRAALLEALRRRGVVARGSSGVNVWVSTSDETSALAVLRDQGFAVTPGSLYRFASPPGLRLSIGGLDLSLVERLADAVALAVRASPPGAARPFTA